MTLAHLSDTHLGYRAYSRATPDGFNLREIDVMTSFEACLDAIAEYGPDLVVHAGDLFHVVRPSNAVIVRAFRLLSAFQSRRAAKPFVLIGGNHDTPRTSDSGNLLRLFETIPGMIVRTGGAEYVDLPSLDAEVLCVPSTSLTARERVDYVPSGRRKHAIFTLHGLATGLHRDAGEFDVDQTPLDRWTYVALGDFHVHKVYAGNACYAGSTDFTSSNIWEERQVPKGWVAFDTDAGRMDFRTVRTRPVMDLARLDAQGLDIERLEEALRSAAVWPEEPLPIVRQVVMNVPPEWRSKLVLGVQREIGHRALHYRLDLVPPQATVAGDGTVHGPAATLEQAWTEHAREATLPLGLSREALLDLGLQLLTEVSEREADPVEA
jgi:DNA repair protein SbcD/Mre11